MKRKKKPAMSRAPLVVATVHTPRGLRQAARSVPKGIDLVEIRLDCLARHSEIVSEFGPLIRCPLLFTARHPREGGASGVPAGHRRFVLEQFLPLASAVDVELRSVPDMRDTTSAVRRAGKTLVLSFHDFGRTPPLADLRAKVASARRAGADVVKIASTLRSARDLATLLLLQTSHPQIGLATMGMGPLGRVSRLVLAAAGSHLNYGYLDRAQVEGQWEAPVLAARLGEVLP
ncbi:MAG: type I 3-dehydroquinate dehydratase [Chthoniobacterales bacterium]|nr:type I 3-dehydroquinate dehydratase [Chthoniobacterales bacterium]